MEIPDDLDHVVGFRRVQSRGGLVQQQNTGLEKQGSGQLRLLLHSIGKILYRYGSVCIDAEPGENPVNFFENPIFLPAIAGSKKKRVQVRIVSSEMKGRFQIFLQSHPLHKPDVLKGSGNSESGNIVRSFAENIPVIEENLSGGSPKNSRKKIENRGFTRSIRADKPQKLSFGESKGKGIHRSETTESFGEFFYLQQCASLPKRARFMVHGKGERAGNFRPFPEVCDEKRFFQIRSTYLPA